MAKTLDSFIKFFSRRETNVKKFEQRAAEVHSKLIDVYLYLDNWKKISEKASGSMKDLRWQLFLDSEQELRDTLTFWKKRGKKDPGEAWAELGELSGKIDTLLSDMETEHDIPFKDSKLGVSIVVLSYNLLEVSDRREWVNSAAVGIEVSALLPAELLEDENAILYQRVQTSAADAARPYRAEAASMVSKVEKHINTVFDGDPDHIPERSELQEITEMITTLNTELRQMAEAAADEAITAAQKMLKEIKSEEESRSNWIFRFVKKLVFGIISLGVSIARLVVSLGTDAFAWVGGVKSLIAIGSELYDAWKDAQTVHRSLMEKITTLKEQVDGVKLKAQAKSTAKEIGQELLGLLGITPSLTGLVITTIGNTADELTLFRSKLRGIDNKSGKLLMTVNGALEDVKAMLGDEVTSIDGTKLNKLRQKVNDTLEKIIEMQTSVSGFHVDAMQSEVVLKNYTRAFDGLYQTAEQKNIGIGDLFTVIGFATGIDKCFGSPMTDFAVNGVTGLLADVTDGAINLNT